MEKLKGVLDIDSIKTSVESLSIVNYTNNSSTDEDKYLITKGYSAYNGSEFVVHPESNYVSSTNTVYSDRFEETNLVPKDALNTIKKLSFSSNSSEAGKATYNAPIISNTKIRNGKKYYRYEKSKEVIRGTVNFINNNSSNLISNALILSSQSFYKDSATLINGSETTSYASNLVYLPIETKDIIDDPKYIENGKLFINKKGKICSGLYSLINVSKGNSFYGVYPNDSINNEIPVYLMPGKRFLLRKGNQKNPFKIIPYTILIPNVSLSKLKILFSNMCYSLSTTSPVNFIAAYDSFYTNPINREKFKLYPYVHLQELTLNLLSATSAKPRTEMTMRAKLNLDTGNTPDFIFNVFYHPTTGSLSQADYPIKPELKVQPVVLHLSTTTPDNLSGIIE